MKIVRLATMATMTTVAAFSPAISHGQELERPRTSPNLKAEIFDAPAGAARAWIGLELAPVPEALGAHLKVPAGEGALVERVLPDSPAARAGIQQHDVIVKAREEVIPSPEALSQLIAGSQPGDKIAISLLRAGTPLNVEVQVAAPTERMRVPRRNGTSPAEAHGMVTQGFLGVMAGPLPEAIRSQLNIPEDQGLLVEEVEDETPAAKAGVKEHDVLLKVDATPLRDSEQLRSIIAVRKKGETVDLTLIRGGKELVLKAELAEREFARSSRWHEQARDAYERATRDLRKRVPAQLGREAEDMGKQIERAMKDGMERMQKELEEARAQSEGARHSVADAINRMKSLLGNVGGNVEMSSSSSNNVQIADSEGRIQVTGTNGIAHIKAWDKDGKEIYSGPWNTEEDKAKAPEAVQRRAKGIVLGPGARTSASSSTGPGSIRSGKTSSAVRNTIRLKDAEGEVIQKITPDGQTVTVTDLDGKPVYEGPWNSPEDKSKAPESVRNRIEKATQNVKVETQVFSNE